MSFFPKYVDLEFTARCNLKCGFCFGPVDHGRKELDLDGHFWIEVINQLRDRDCEGIVVSGGEPTIYPSLLKLLIHAKKLGLKTVVSTHGRNTARVLDIAEYCDWIALPVDAASHSALRKMRGDAWGLQAAQRLAIQLKARTNGKTLIKLGTVATALNKDEILILAKELVDFDEHAFDTWKIYQYTPRRKFKDSKEVYELTDEKYFNLAQLVESTGIRAHLNTVFSSNESRRGAYLFVYPDGTLASPNNGEDFGDIVFGNLRTEGMCIFDQVTSSNFVLNIANFESTYV